MSSKAIDPSLARILIVDDEEVVLSVLKQQLEPEGFQLTTVSSGAKALEALASGSFTIIIADHEMAGMSGLDLLSKVSKDYPTVTRLLLTSTLTLKELFESINSNLIDRFITKPWLREELLIVLRNSVACRLSGVSLEGSSTEQAEQEPSADASADVAVGDEAAAHSNSPVDIFIKMLGTFNPNLGNTAIRAMALCEKVGEVLGLPTMETQSLMWAAGLADISLVAVDRGIVRRWLRSPEKCTEEELATIKKHPAESQEMLANYPDFKDALEVIRAHHESWDGTGYPDRLKGETIPWLSRLLSVATYVCSKHQGPAQALGEAQSLADKVFDPRAVEVVAKAVPLTELPRGEREILMIELQPGMMIARDILNASGVLVIAKDKELTAAWLNKILNINNMTPLNPIVLVYC
ncbi:MAG: response regulator [Pedosphaera sp.]|nr:response regulator [Pedosphaera sp.]